MWFEKLTGFQEKSPATVRKNLIIEGARLFSKVNQKSWQWGELQICSLQELQVSAQNPGNYPAKIKVSEVINDSRSLLLDPENAGALFQVASQFNLLEMTGPSITPEAGVDIYEQDHTQGPACAIACGAGTIYRNYFVPVNGQIGQSAHNQIDCLDLVGRALHNEVNQYWRMRNGYALFDHGKIHALGDRLAEMKVEERESLKHQLKIGLQWDTQVTIAPELLIVSQAYCSALPVAYNGIQPENLEELARIILEATYEATLQASLINYEKTGSNKVFLTLVGGGVFGNKMDWVLDSIAIAVEKFKHSPLDVKIVSFKKSNPALVQKGIITID